MIDVALWYLFPIAILIASISMLIGVGGAILFTPLFIIFLDFEPIHALAAGMIIEIFALSSGLFAYLEKKILPLQELRKLTLFVIFGTFIGVIIAQFIPSLFIQIGLFLLLSYFSYSFISDGRECLHKHPDLTHHHYHPKLTIDSTTKYTSTFGGFLLGLLSAGLGEVNEYNFLQRKKLSPSVAAGSSIFLISISATVSIIIHMIFIISKQELYVFSQILSILIFCVPGVIIGAQLGVHLTKRFSNGGIELFAGVLFLFLAAIMIVNIALF
ncbi:MAG: sulfite exporter TauE/SafE family protein [Candidatus Nanoarchaeia archaeon]